jgi:hypothetical protein
MPRIRVQFSQFDLINDEEQIGGTFVGLFASLRDSSNIELASFSTNFNGDRGTLVIGNLDVVRPPTAFQVDVSGPWTITVSAVADDDTPSRLHKSMKTT